MLLSSAIATFSAQQTFGTSNNPASLVIADMNSDGKLDAIVANTNSNNVGILLGNGNGTFQTQQTFAVGSHPPCVAVADVNGDGKLDVVTANQISNTVSVLLGNGDGTLQAQQVYSTGVSPRFVAVADVNGDGKPDLVVSNNTSGTIGLLLGNGDGTFQTQQTFTVGSHPLGLVVADLNGDGKPDVAVVNNGYPHYSVSVLAGNGDGTLANQQTFTVGAGPYSIATSDLNGDGKLDLAIANLNGSTVSVLLGNGNGTFAAQSAIAVGAKPRSVRISDINRDGRPDLVIANSSGTILSVLLGNGNATYQLPKTFTCGMRPYSVVTADINGDGVPDLISANFTSNSISALLGDVPPTVLSINRTSPPGPITSDPSVTYTVTFNELVTGVDPSDFASATTGTVSAAVPVVVTPVNGSVYSVAISAITGTGTLGLNLVDDGSIKDAAGNPLQPGGVPGFQSEPVQSGVSKCGSLVVADLNGDGKNDLIIGNNAYGRVSVLLANGDGTFRAPQTFSDGGSVPASIAVSDLNGDGKPDLVTANGSANTVGVLLGNGNGTFQAQQTFPTGTNAYSVVVSDVNGDGRADLVVANLGSNTISVMLGNGNGTFQIQQTLASGGAPRSVAVSDVNGDGKPDLIVANSGSNAVSVLLGNGNGTFQTQKTFAAGTAPEFVAVSDLNGDSRPDLAVANYSGGTVGILLGNGDGTFQAQQTYVTGAARSLAISDINGDGRQDLIVASYGPSGPSNTNIVGELLGNGNGTFQAQRTLQKSSTPGPVAASDLNGDGRPDIVDGQGGSQVTVLLANSNANFTGQTYTIVPSLDTISGTAGVDHITLTQDPDNTHIDWTLNGSGPNQMAITDPNGLTVNGNGSNDLITLQYSPNSPLPATLHLNGTFTINGLQGSSPLLNTTLEIGRSTVFISYVSSAADPIAAIRQYLQNGYNNGAWNGIPAASPAFPGDITSIPAAQNAAQTTAIGYADSADGLIVGQPANTIELKYTLYGDTTLTGIVGFNDFTRLTQHYNQTSGGTWDTGDFNYDGSVNFGDFILMTRTYNTGLGNQAMPAISPVAQAKPVVEKHHHAVARKSERRNRHR